MLFNLTEGPSEPVPSYYQLLKSTYEIEFVKIHSIKNLIYDIEKCWNQIQISKLHDRFYLTLLSLISFLIAFYCTCYCLYFKGDLIMIVLLSFVCNLSRHYITKFIFKVIFMHSKTSLQSQMI